jgi:hypothetical protein
MWPPILARASKGGPFDLLAPGLYAWGLTVAWPATMRWVPVQTRIFALVALVALVAGAGLAFIAPRLGRIVAIWLFLGACVASWAKVEPSLFLARLDPLQGLLGSFGWALFALSWARQDKSIPLATAEANPTPAPRQTMPRQLTAMVVLVCAAAALPIVVAWWVKGFERALVAQTIALATAVALLSLGAELADTGVARGGLQARSPPTMRLSGAAPALLALGILAALGAAWGLMR